MRRVIRKRIRHTENGIEVAADVNAEIAINVGGREPAEPLPDDPARAEDNDQEGKES